MTQGVVAPTLYDPFDAAIHLEPYASYERLRRDFPLYRNEARGFWALSRYADVVRAARDERRFSASRPTLDPDDGVYGLRDPDWIAGESPRHAVLHKLMAPHLGRPAAARLRAVVRDAVARLVDRAVARGCVDFVDAVAKPLPIAVICELWGLPPDVWSELEELGDRMWRRVPGELSVPADAGVAYMGFRAVVESVRTRERGVLGALERARRAGLIEASEVVDVSVLVPATGFKTSSALLAASVLQLAAHPAAPRDARLFVEEVLRFDPPVHWLPRVTLEDVELEHGSLAAGERVLLLLGSANRDERRFPDADRFDPARGGPRHVAFGFGVHYCVGALLARMMATALLERLLARVERVELAGPPERIYSSLGEREFQSLPVRFIEPRAPSPARRARASEAR